MRHFIALIHKDRDSDYGVSFPDLPGCVTAGGDLDEARANAEDALKFHVEGMLADGEAVPEPSSLEQIMADPENRDGVAVLIADRSAGSRAIRINITVPEDTLGEIDRFASEHGMSRSGFLVSAARQVISAA